MSCSTSPQGWAGDFVIGSVEQPLPPDAAGTDLVGATERLAHVRELLPEICTPRLRDDEFW